MTQKCGPEVRKKRVPPTKPRREFDSLRLLARADVPGVGSIRLGREACLHQVELQVEHAVLQHEAHECAGEDLGDWHLRSLLKHNLCGCAGDERQSARLDEARSIIFNLYHRLVRTVLEVLRET